MNFRACLRLIGGLVAFGMAAAATRAIDLDFGDAPAPFPVTLAEDGARHGTGGLLRLGPTRTIEPDGVHSANALSAAEGDDGVTAALLWQKETMVTVTITVSAACRLDAWVDWARNGQWTGSADDALDRIASSRPLTAGANTLVVFVPASAKAGQTFARFRVSTGGLLGPTGEAPDGEVEDYPLGLTETATPGGVTLTVATNGAGRSVVRWLGNAAYSSQFEHSTDLTNWLRLDLPFGEIAGTMEMELPLFTLTGATHFFRLRRQPLSTTPVPTTPGYYTDLTFTHGGLTRTYFLKIPLGWNPGQTWPIAFLLPGHGQSAQEFSTNQSEILARADARGWILVFGEATSGYISFAWFSYDNPNTAPPPFHGTQPYIDDAAFLFALVEYLKNSGLRIEPARVYAAGFSNGGGMCHYLAGKANHPFAAFAIMESGTEPIAHYPDPYDRDFSTIGGILPARVPAPSQPRPALMMNMATSIFWRFEGTLLQPTLYFSGARHNVARWTQANGFGSVAQPPPQPPLPPAALSKTTTPWSATGSNRASVGYDDMRPDQGWPASLASQPGWTLGLAQRFPNEPFIPLDPVRNEYTHTISPDPSAPLARIRVDAGTMTSEVWRSAPANSTNEVIFVGLSDGGHAWPGTDDKLPFNANVRVLDFFEAH